MDLAGLRAAREASRGAEEVVFSEEAVAVAFSDSEGVAAKGEADFSVSKLERDDVLTR